MGDQSGKFDLVITGGRVIDPETRLDAVRNVGIKGNKIAAVTEKAIQGKETIDASGHVVCPGFIDMHHHNVGIPFGEKLALRDGVTTPMELEAGVYPVDEFYAALEGKCRANYGASSGTLAVREHILNPEYRTCFAGFFIWDLLGDPKDSKASMHWSTDVATPEQIEEYERLLEEGLQQGAVGVGHAVGYMDVGCSQEESAIVQKLADKGRIQEGKDADITIFDPKTVQDNATMKDGGLPSTGLPYVLVNGTVVVRDSETVDDVFPGRPIKGSATAV